MLIDKRSIEYQLNKDALREMEEVVPMTLSERTAIRKWVKCGHEVESNPWGHFDGDGLMLNYLQAYRLEHGYSSGPWDGWRGPDTYWYDSEHSLLIPEEL